MDFSNLSPLQKKVATYLSERKGKVVTFGELLTSCWGDSYSDKLAVDRNLVQKAIARIRKRLGEYCVITTRDRSGYIWIGDYGNTVLTDDSNTTGLTIRDTILPSARAFDEAVTMARLFSNGEEFVLQLVQSVGRKAHRIELDLLEWNHLANFVSMNSNIHC